MSSRLLDLASVAAPEDTLLDEARRSLARQENTLDVLRTKSVGVLATGGIVAGLAAPKVVSHTAATVPAYVALAAFVASALVGIYVLKPHGFEFSENLASYAGWIRQHDAEPGADRAFILGLAENLEANRRDNRDKLGWLTRLFAWQCGLLAAQVICWAIAYALA
ncbi:MAG TPA: hypothetical protein VLL25_09060 [Acidimicrobiales bacterium]|nr:hypothetical protein [Acidimicrobiales bacterium]